MVWSLVSSIWAANEQEQISHVMYDLYNMPISYRCSRLVGPGKEFVAIWECFYDSASPLPKPSIACVCVYVYLPLQAAKSKNNMRDRLVFTITSS